MMVLFFTIKSGLFRSIRTSSGFTSFLWKSRVRLKPTPLKTRFLKYRVLEEISGSGSGSGFPHTGSTRLANSRQAMATVHNDSEFHFILEKFCFLLQPKKEFIETQNRFYISPEFCAQGGGATRDTQKFTKGESATTITKDSRGFEDDESTKCVWQMWRSVYVHKDFFCSFINSSRCASVGWCKP